MALVVFTYRSQRLEIDISYVLFVGASTMLTYSLHRLVGIRRMGRFNKAGRFAIIQHYRSHIVFYAVLSAIVCGVLFWLFDWQMQVYLACAAIISLSYTLPIFGAGRRLRDFAFIKIFMIAMVWSFVTEAIILLEESTGSRVMTLLAFVERFLYFVAITIPFDIRDIVIDKSSKVRTLPTTLGIGNSLLISYSCLVFAIVIALVSRPSEQSLPLTTCYGVSVLLVFLSKDKKADLWYSGFLDGTMSLPLLVYLLYSTIQ